MIISFATVGETSANPAEFRDTPIVLRQAARKRATTMTDLRMITPYDSSRELQLELCSHLSDEGPGDVAQRPLAVTLQFAAGVEIEAELLERAQDHRIAPARHRTVVDLQRHP